MLPCEHCGAKPGRGGVVKMHKKGCSTKQGKYELHPTDKETYFDVPTIGFVCCDLPMSRTNGGPRDVSCRHHRLLTDNCAECRREHNNILVWECRVCGRRVQDAPHLAQGHEATMARDQVRDGS